MSSFLPPRRLLASNGNMQVRELLDGSVQLKPGEANLLFTRDDFQLLVSLVSAISLPHDNEDVLLAAAGQGRTITYHASRQRLVIQFDHVRLAMAAADVPLFVALCRKAAAALAAPPPNDYRTIVTQQQRWN
ncbi:MAG: hypothetical protein MUD01_10115 [Chloroflexaceae bacterium]|nr:hypothetical protein [Chloroflexaceae bacterium]